MQCIFLLEYLGSMAAITGAFQQRMLDRFTPQEVVHLSVLAGRAQILEGLAVAQVQRELFQPVRTELATDARALEAADWRIGHLAAATVDINAARADASGHLVGNRGVGRGDRANRADAAGQGGQSQCADERLRRRSARHEGEEGRRQHGAA